jgi:ferredoxin
MSWHIALDRAACIGSGSCAALLPERFGLDGPAARVRDPEAGEPDETLLDAADSCPAGAITVTDTASGEVVGPRP